MLSLPVCVRHRRACAHSRSCNHLRQLASAPRVLAQDPCFYVSMNPRTLAVPARRDQLVKNTTGGNHSCPMSPARVSAHPLLFPDHRRPPWSASALQHRLSRTALQAYSQRAVPAVPASCPRACATSVPLSRNRRPVVLPGLPGPTVDRPFKSRGLPAVLCPPFCLCETVPSRVTLAPNALVHGISSSVSRFDFISRSLCTALRGSTSCGSRLEARTHLWRAWETGP
ncbi:hypothetical protein C8Q76DRAFT_319168 [Earliella scabrosa]|nr:hypothetical protein C8Q76DRAFT_319168 [Earliella scabrosa]